MCAWLALIFFQLGRSKGRKENTATGWPGETKRNSFFSVVFCHWLHLILEVTIILQVRVWGGSQMWTRENYTQPKSQATNLTNVQWSHKQSCIAKYSYFCVAITLKSSSLLSVLYWYEIWNVRTTKRLLFKKSLILKKGLGLGFYFTLTLQPCGGPIPVRLQYDCRIPFLLWVFPLKIPTEAAIGSGKVTYHLRWEMLTSGRNPTASVGQTHFAVISA